MVKNTTVVQKNIVDKIKSNKEIGSEINSLVGQCSFSKWKKSLIVSDNTKKAEGSSDFLKNLDKKWSIISQKMPKNVSKNPGRALEIGANVGTAFATRSPKAALSSVPEMINFYHTGKSLDLGKFVWLIPYKWNKKQIEYTQQHHLKLKILI